MPYDNEYNRMVARDIEYFNRKYVAHSDATGQGTVDYRVQMSGSGKLGGGKGCAEYKMGSSSKEGAGMMMGGTILGFQDGTIMGGPKPERMTRGQLSSYSSLGAPLQPPSGAVFRLGSIDPVRDLGSMRDAVGESIDRTLGAGKMDSSAKKEQKMIKKLMAEEKKAEKESHSKSQKLVKESKKKTKNNKKGGAEKVGSEAELKRILDKEIKKEQKNINSESKKVAEQEATKGVNKEVQKITSGASGAGKGGFLRRAAAAVKSVAKKAAPIVKAVAPIAKQVMTPQTGPDGKPVSLLNRLGNAAMTHGAPLLARAMAPPQPPPESEPPPQYFNDGFFPGDFEDNDSFSSYSSSSSESESEDESSGKKGKKGKKGNKGKKGKKGKKDKGEKECPPCKDAYDIASGENNEAAPNDTLNADSKPVRTRDNGFFGSGSKKRMPKEMKPKKERKSRKGSGMVTSVNATNGRQTMPMERAQMRSSTLSGMGKPKGARAAIVKKVMNEKGLSMIEASKYVKKNGLY